MSWNLWCLWIFLIPCVFGISCEFQVSQEICGTFASGVSRISWNLWTCQRISWGRRNLKNIWACLWPFLNESCESKAISGLGKSLWISVGLWKSVGMWRISWISWISGIHKILRNFKRPPCNPDILKNPKSFQIQKGSHNSHPVQPIPILLQPKSNPNPILIQCSFTSSPPLCNPRSAPDQSQSTASPVRVQP